MQLQKAQLIDVKQGCLLELQKRPAFLCDSLKSHNSRPGLIHVIEIPKTAKKSIIFMEYGLPYHIILIKYYTFTNIHRLEDI
jgi:hypothetical protein